MDWAGCARITRRWPGLTKWMAVSAGPECPVNVRWTWETSSQSFSKSLRKLSTKRARLRRSQSASLNWMDEGRCSPLIASSDRGVGLGRLGMTDVPNIALRAYQLWDAAGRPEGRSDEFYLVAEEELRLLIEEQTALMEENPFGNDDKCLTLRDPPADP